MPGKDLSGMGLSSLSKYFALNVFPPMIILGLPYGMTSLVESLVRLGYVYLTCSKAVCMSLLLGGMIDLGTPWYFPPFSRGKEMKFSMDLIVFSLISAMVSSKVSMYFSLRKSARSEEQFLVVVVAFMMVLSSR